MSGLVEQFRDRQRDENARIARVLEAQIVSDAPPPGNFRARLMRTSTNYRPNIL